MAWYSTPPAIFMLQQKLGNVDVAREDVIEFTVEDVIEFTVEDVIEFTDVPHSWSLSVPTGRSWKVDGVIRSRFLLSTAGGAGCLFGLMGSAPCIARVAFIDWMKVCSSSSPFSFVVRSSCVDYDVYGLNVLPLLRVRLRVLIIIRFFFVLVLCLLFFLWAHCQ